MNPSTETKEAEVVMEKELHRIGDKLSLIFFILCFISGVLIVAH